MTRVCEPVFSRLQVHLLAWAILVVNLTIGFAQTTVFSTRVCSIRAMSITYRCQRVAQKRSAAVLRIQLDDNTK